MTDATKAPLPEFTAKEVAAHNAKGDLWIVVHGEVFDVSKYIHDHPGGADVFAEVAGADGSDAFDNAQHSEDALEIKDGLRIGRLKGQDGQKKKTLKAVRLIPASATSVQAKKEERSGVSRAVTVLSVGLGSSLACVGVWWGAKGLNLSGGMPSRATLTPSFLSGGRKGLGFSEGVLLTSAVFALTVGWAVRRFMTTMSLWSGQWRYQPHMVIPKMAKPDKLNERGWLDGGVFQKLPLVKKELLCPNTYRFVFALPKPNAVLGLPIGQHVSIRGLVEGKMVSRSYTPISNNVDRGVLELVIRCYDNGVFTNGYLKNLQVGDEVEFRGPKGAIRYRQGMCDKIGMVAGGTGITPMYQLIRAICENPRDTTEVSLLYANRSEDDMLLRDELEAFARKYAGNFKIHYVLDKPPAGWQGGQGFVTKDMIAERLPAVSPSTKIFLCGPPPMVESCKKSLGGLGFQQPGAIAKPSDEVLCF